MTDWFDVNTGPPFRTFWWAIEHRASSGELHPAFFLRALMPGDFREVGTGPDPRHAVDLEGEPAPSGERVKCSTCGQIPRPEDLEPIERVSGDRGHLDPYRKHAIVWPAPTPAASCWLCSAPDRPTRHRVPRSDLIEGKANGLEVLALCDPCEAFVRRWAIVHPGPHIRTTDGDLVVVAEGED